MYVGFNLLYNVRLLQYTSSGNGSGGSVVIEASGLLMIGGVSGGMAGLFLLMAVIISSIVVVLRRDYKKKNYQISVLMSQVKVLEGIQEELKGTVIQFQSFQMSPDAYPFNESNNILAI